MTKYKYLLFDLDGTILDFDAAEKAAIKSLFKRFGLGECSDEMILRYSKINKKYWKALELGQMTKSRILVERFAEFFSTEGLNTNVASDFNDAYQIELGETAVFCENAFSLVQKLSESYTLAIITNGTKIAQVKKLATSGLDKIIPNVFISEDVGFDKPNIKFFEKVVSEMHIAELKEALIIGDSMTSDIQGGVNSGIDTCLYNPKKENYESKIKPTYEINKLCELENILCV